MNTNNPKVKVISVKEAGKMDKNNVAYFTLNDGTVAIVKKDDQKIPNTELLNEVNNKNSIYQKYEQIQNNNIQQNNNINSNYSIMKIKNSNQNNININNQNLNQNNTDYQIIEAIPVKFCENPQIKNFSQPEPLYVQPYYNPEIIFSEVQKYDDNDEEQGYYEENQINNINIRNMRLNQSRWSRPRRDWARRECRRRRAHPSTC